MSAKAIDTELTERENQMNITKHRRVSVELSCEELRNALHALLKEFGIHGEIASYRDHGGIFVIDLKDEKID
jgi:hypothetical protein